MSVVKQLVPYETFIQINVNIRFIFSKTEYVVYSILKTNYLITLM